MANKDKYAQYFDETLLGEAGPGNAENMIIDEMLTEDTDMLGGSSYSTMEPREKMMYDALAFKYYANEYANRDQNKYGKLSFENFISGLTPEEVFINELGAMLPGDDSMTTANMWNQIFGENTQEMGQAAMDYRNQNDITMATEDPRYADIIAR
jgi:hypothetical protein